MRYGHKMTSWNGIANFLKHKQLIGSENLNVFRNQLGGVIHEFLTSKNIRHNTNPKYLDCDKNCYLVQENWSEFVQYAEKQPKITTDSRSVLKLKQHLKNS